MLKSSNCYHSSQLTTHNSTQLYPTLLFVAPCCSTLARYGIIVCTIYTSKNHCYVSTELYTITVCHYTSTSWLKLNAAASARRSQSQTHQSYLRVFKTIFIILSTFAINYIHVRVVPVRSDDDADDEDDVERRRRPTWNTVSSYHKSPKAQLDVYGDGGCVRRVYSSCQCSVFTSQQQRRIPYIGRLNWPLVIHIAHSTQHRAYTHTHTRSLNLAAAGAAKESIRLQSRVYFFPSLLAFHRRLCAQSLVAVMSLFAPTQNHKKRK